MKLVYGHTDSIYVQMPMDKAEETRDLLNNHVRNAFPNLLELDDHPITLEFEKYFKSLGVGITKNRNAGLISWKDGNYLDEPEFTMTGFTAKRIAQTDLEKKTQLEILRMWVEGKSELEITTTLKLKYNTISTGNIELKTLINRSRYRPERFIYKCKHCNVQSTVEELLNHNCASYCFKCGNDTSLVTLEGKNPSIGSGVEGVMWWNQNHNNKLVDSYIYIRIMDDPIRTLYRNPLNGVYKRPTYISAPNEKNLLDCNITPDYYHYAEAIVKKAKPIYEAMGWDFTQIRQDINQKTLDEWW